jgi:sugar/nucleoside kinase (ribokinase family)
MSEIDQTPQKLKLVLVKGDDLTFTLNFGQSMVSYALTAFSTINGVNTDNIHLTAISATAGTYTVDIQASQTSVIEAGVHEWLLRWHDPAGDVRTIIQDEFEVLE